MDFLRPQRILCQETEQENERSIKEQASSSSRKHACAFLKEKHACEGRAQSHKYNHAELKEHGAAQKSQKHLKLKNEPEC